MDAPESITIRRLKLLEAVSRCRNFTQVAREMHIAQPSVSIQIRQLEEAVGQKLVQKVNNAVSLTEAGEKVLAASHDILGRLDRLRDELDALHGHVSGSLRIAVVTSAKYFLPHYLGPFVREYKNVQPRLMVTNRAKILEELAENRHDLYVMGQIPAEMKVKVYPFRNNILEVMAAPNHPLQKEKNIPLERLAQENFLIREQGSGTRTAMERLVKEKNLPPIRPYMELGSGDAITHGVMAGLGIAVLSRHSLKFELAAGSIRALDAEDFPMERRWYIVHSAQKALPRAAEVFLDYLIENKDMQI